jgi:hypothetical protein
MRRYMVGVALAAIVSLAAACGGANTPTSNSTGGSPPSTVPPPGLSLEQLSAVIRSTPGLPAPVCQSDDPTGDLSGAYGLREFDVGGNLQPSSLNLPGPGPHLVCSGGLGGPTLRKYHDAAHAASGERDLASNGSWLALWLSGNYLVGIGQSTSPEIARPFAATLDHTPGVRHVYGTVE